MQITLLPGEWANRAWAGHLCGTKLPPGLQREQELLLRITKISRVIYSTGNHRKANPKGIADNMIVCIDSYKRSNTKAVSGRIADSNFQSAIQQQSPRPCSP